MKIKGKVHCFFEQSGTFKNEFIKLGIPAEDYDIQDQFGQTDHVIDLFAEIETAYRGGGESVFDSITDDDLIIAFFPCIYFSQQNATFFNGSNINWKNYNMMETSRMIVERSRERERHYEVCLKMFALCDTAGLRLVVENPCSTPHYLHNNFPYKPSIIDKNRQLRGDYFPKPTQYWFVNCTPTIGFSYTKPTTKMTVNALRGHKGNLCDTERSMISPDYARNFICDFILGKEQQNTLPQLPFKD